LIGGQGAGRITGINGRAAGQQGVGEGGAAVILQRAEQRIGIGERIGMSPATATIAVQVPAVVGEPTEIHTIRAGNLVGHNGVLQMGRVIVPNATAGTRGVGADGVGVRRVVSGGHV